jgi:adenylate cyclase class IV
MTNIEVEHRGVLSKEKFKELSALLKERGKFVKEKDRFSVIYFPRGKERLKVSKSPLDLRVRITNKKSELILKYGRTSGNDARKGFSFPVDSGKFEATTEFLKILGFYYGILQATKTYVYMYKDIEFALVDVPGWGYYFEAEKLTDVKSIENANKKIELACKEFDLDILNDKDFYNLLEDLGNRPGFRFNFKKKTFSTIKKRFLDYF